MDIESFREAHHYVTGADRNVEQYREERRTSRTKYGVTTMYLVKMGIQAEAVKISDLEAMLDKGVMKTPAVCLGGRKVLEGRAPKKEEVKAWLKDRV